MCSEVFQHLPSGPGLSLTYSRAWPGRAWATPPPLVRLLSPKLPLIKAAAAGMEGFQRTWSSAEYDQHANRPERQELAPGSLTSYPESSLQ